MVIRPPQTKHTLPYPTTPNHGKHWKSMATCHLPARCRQERNPKAPPPCKQGHSTAKPNTAKSNTHTYTAHNSPDFFLQEDMLLMGYASSYAGGSQQKDPVCKLQWTFVNQNISFMILNQSFATESELSILSTQAFVASSLKFS